MDPREWLCPFEDRPAEHLHHWTGGDDQNRYLDMGLVGPLSALQNGLENQVWNWVGLGKIEGRDLNWIRLKRSGVHVVRMAEEHLGDRRGDEVTLPAKTVEKWGHMVGRVRVAWGLRAGCPLGQLSSGLVTLARKNRGSAVLFEGERLREFGLLQQREADRIAPNGLWTP